MLFKPCLQINTIPVILIALIGIGLLIIPVVVVNAVPGDNIDERCDKIYDESNPTIGKVECCSDFIQEDGKFKSYCTTCDATNPPSNCSERYPTLDYREKPQFESDQPFIPGGGQAVDKLDENQIEQAQPSKSQNNDLSTSEQTLSDSTDLGSSNTFQESDDSNPEENNDNSSQ